MLRNKSLQVDDCPAVISRSLYAAFKLERCRYNMNEARTGFWLGDVKTTRMLLLRANHSGGQYGCGSRNLTHLATPAHPSTSHLITPPP